MSTFVFGSASTAHPRTENEEAVYAQGQRHDRMPSTSDKVSSLTSIDAGQEAMERDISASQKMLSAVSGSLLTSVLGKISGEGYGYSVANSNQ